MRRFQNARQPDWNWWGRLWPTPGESLRELGVCSGDTVAEVGSGNGYFALPAARITAPGTVYALDIDESLLAELSHLAELQAIENITTLTGDARNLSQHLPEQVDVILISNTFHGISKPDAFVQQAFESLRPGGCFIIINWRNTARETTQIAGESRGPPTELRLAPEETERIVLGAAEFVLEKTIDLPPYHYALAFER